MLIFLDQLDRCDYGTWFLYLYPQAQDWESIIILSSKKVEKRLIWEASTLSVTPNPTFCFIFPGPALRLVVLIDVITFRSDARSSLSWSSSGITAWKSNLFSPTLSPLKTFPLSGLTRCSIFFLLTYGWADKDREMEKRLFAIKKFMLAAKNLSTLSYNIWSITHYRSVLSFTHLAPSLTLCEVSYPMTRDMVYGGKVAAMTMIKLLLALRKGTTTTSFLRIKIGLFFERWEDTWSGKSFLFRNVLAIRIVDW